MNETGARSSGIFNKGDKTRIMGTKGKGKLGLDRQYWKFLMAYTLCRAEVDYPFQWLMVEPTNHCNLRCIMCPQEGRMTRKKGFMEFSLFRKILDETADFLKAMQLFHSGEALLHPQIFDMVRCAASRNIYTLMNTNGTLLDESKARKVLDSGLNSLSFSFDSFDKKTYESIRVGARFDRTLKNMEGLLNMKAQRGQRRPRTIIEIIEMVETRPHIETFVRRGKEMGFDEVRVWKFHNWTDDDGVKDRHSPFSGDSRIYRPCEYPFFLMAVYWDGTVVPCCVDYNGAYRLGNVAANPLTSIWNNQKSRHLRRTMRTRITPKKSLCSDCSLLTQPRSYRSLPGMLFNGYARLVGFLRR